MAFFRQFTFITSYLWPRLNVINGSTLGATSISSSYLAISSKRSLHANCNCLWKYQTDTELVHRGVMYGHAAYPTRPNDPRVPANVQFGKVGLRIEQSEPSISITNENHGSSNKSGSTVSAAMKAYLDRARQYNQSLMAAEEEYNIGRRHLANMMGLTNGPSGMMSQETIDAAIRYLLPSGLFDHRARPRMRPPRELYPALKEAQFAANGRPHHSLYYTGKANFYQICYEMEQQFERMKMFEDETHLHQKTIPSSSSPSTPPMITTNRWLTRLQMQQLLKEKLSQHHYEVLCDALDCLASHPHSTLVEPFLAQYRAPPATKPAATTMENIPALQFDADGRPWSQATGTRKHCFAQVLVRGNGTGKVHINGHDSILYFEHIADREQVMTPLTFTGLLGKVDVHCRTMYIECTRSWSEDAWPFIDKCYNLQHGGSVDDNDDGDDHNHDHNLRVVNRTLGTSTQSGAIRLALSFALRSFVDHHTVCAMHAVGLLTRDTRIKERKKPGQEGARRKFTWKKR